MLFRSSLPQVVEGPWIALRANDLADGIAQVSLQGALTVEESGGDALVPGADREVRRSTFMADARLLCGATSSIPAPTSLTLLELPPSSTSRALLDHLPSEQDAQAAYQNYASSAASALVPLHGPTFDRQRYELRQASDSRTDPDLHFLASHFAVCASGLASMPHEDASRRALAAQWIDLAYQALLEGKVVHGH